MNLKMVFRSWADQHPEYRGEQRERIPQSEIATFRVAARYITEDQIRAQNPGLVSYLGANMLKVKCSIKRDFVVAFTIVLEGEYKTPREQWEVYRWRGRGASILRPIVKGRSYREIEVAMRSIRA